MPKTSWNDYSATAGNNTDVDSINIAEGCSPAGINNAIREIMAHTADVVAGTTALSTINIDGGAIDGVTIGAAAAPTVTNLGSVATCDINGGSIDNVTIGAATAAAGTFTTVSATTVSATTFGSENQMAYGARTVSTSDPTGGSNGDVWFKY